MSAEQIAEGRMMLGSGETLSTAAEAFGRPGEWIEVAEANLGVLFEGFERPELEGFQLYQVASLRASAGMVIVMPPRWARTDERAADDDDDDDDAGQDDTRARPASRPQQQQYRRR